MTPPLTDPGVTVATGDPDGLSSAASAHEGLASTLDAHSSQISSSSTRLAASWKGESATAYHQLSALVAAHFTSAAGGARDAAGALRTFSHTLADAQTDGQHALTQAIDWMNKVNFWQAKLDAANAAANAAQSSLSSDSSYLTDLNKTGQADQKVMKSAANAVNSDRAATATASADAAHAQMKLTEAQTELLHWQGQGATAYQQAEFAAQLATGHLGTIAVMPPPWTRTSNSPFDGVFPSLLPGLITGAGGGLKGFASLKELNAEENRVPLKSLSDEYAKAYDEAKTLPPEEQEAAMAKLDSMAGDLSAAYKDEAAAAPGLNAAELAASRADIAYGAVEFVIDLASGDSVGHAAIDGASTSAGASVGASALELGCAALPPPADVLAGTGACLVFGGAIGGLVGGVGGGVLNNLLSGDSGPDSVDNVPIPKPPANSHLGDGLTKGQQHEAAHPVVTGSNGQPTEAAYA